MGSETKPATAGNDFGWALRALKSGTPVTRLAWDGKSELRIGAVRPRILRTEFFPDGLISGDWLAPSADLLAEDWVLTSDVKAGA
jgi:hypothetical protein